MKPFNRHDPTIRRWRLSFIVSFKREIFVNTQFNELRVEKLYLGSDDGYLPISRFTNLIDDRTVSAFRQKSSISEQFFRNAQCKGFFHEIDDVFREIFTLYIRR